MRRWSCWHASLAFLYVGAFPAADQNLITYSAGVAIKSAAPNIALSFIRFITGPGAAKRWHAAGFATAQ